MKSLIFWSTCFATFLASSPKAFSQDELSTPEGQSQCSRELVLRADADYVKNVAKYVEVTDKVSPELQATRETFVRLLPLPSSPSGQITIVSIGEGFGRDVKYFRSLGYRTVGTDGSKAMVDYAKTYLGTDKDFYHLIAQDFSLVAVGLSEPVDGIWAMASLHHVPDHELRATFIQIRDALRLGGVVHASFIMGVGTEGKAEVAIDRFWSRITSRRLIEIVSSIEGLEIISESGRKENDFFAKAPSSGFHFYNLWLKRIK